MWHAARSTRSWRTKRYRHTRTRRRVPFCLVTSTRSLCTDTCQKHHSARRRRRPCPPLGGQRYGARRAPTLAQGGSGGAEKRRRLDSINCLFACFCLLLFSHFFIYNSSIVSCLHCWDRSIFVHCCATCGLACGHCGDRDVHTYTMPHTCMQKTQRGKEGSRASWKPSGR